VAPKYREIFKILREEGVFLEGKRRVHSTDSLHLLNRQLLADEFAVRESCYMIQFFRSSILHLPSVLPETFETAEMFLR
jgi:hypothetical protein